MYENTRPASHRMAAELIEAGVDVNDIYRRLYERVPIEKWRLTARALEKIERFDDGRFAVTYISADDYEATGAGEVLHRGHHRLRAGARGGRGRGDDPRQDRRRALGAQGQPALHRRRRRRLGDRRASRAGEGTAAPPASAATCPMRSWSSSCAPRSPPSSVTEAGGEPPRPARSSSPTSRPGSPRTTSSPACAAALGVKGGHAGTLDPFATGLLIVLLGRPATREQRRFMELRKTYRVRARFGAVSTTGDRDGEITETGVIPSGPLELPDRRDPPAPARLLGGQGRRRARLQARPARRGVRDAARAWSPCTGSSCSPPRAPRREFEIECSSGTYVRSLIADLGDAYCTELRRTAIGPFSVEEADEDAADRARRRARTPRLAAQRRRGSATPRTCQSSAPMSIAVTHPARGRPAPARDRDRDLRRRPRRPPAGDRGRRHRAHLRAAPAERDPPRGGAEADHAVRRSSAT